MRTVSTAALLISILLVPAIAFTDESQDLPWDRGYVNLGAYLADVSSSFRLGIDNVGLGVVIDAEKFLGLKTNDYAFRLQAGYRLGGSGKHKFDFDWFSFDRRSEKTLSEEVVLPPDMGGDTLSIGTTINSVFKFDIIKAKYKYSIILDDRLDMNLGVGFYIMPIKIGIGKTEEERSDKDITAPLPVFGLGADLILTPHWLLRENLDVFYLEISSFRGSIVNVQMAVEYSNWEHWGVGAGVDGLLVRVEADGGDYPLMDFVGAISFSYLGAQLYATFRY